MLDALVNRLRSLLLYRPHGSLLNVELSCKQLFVLDLLLPLVSDLLPVTVNDSLSLSKSLRHIIGLSRELLNESLLFEHVSDTALNLP